MVIGQINTVVNDTLVHVSNFTNYQMPKEDSFNWLTILLALIAGLIALYQVKSNVISSARITWIENLRLTLSEYCVVVIDTATLKEKYQILIDNKEKEKKFDEKFEELKSDVFNNNSKMHKLGKKALLYLNSSNPNHKEIETSINEIFKHLNEKEIKNINIKLLEEKTDIIISTSKQVFREEWKKSKRLFRF
jgi:hypothetical protein